MRSKTSTSAKTIPAKTALKTSSTKAAPAKTTSTKTASTKGKSQRVIRENRLPGVDPALGKVIRSYRTAKGRSQNKIALEAELDDDYLSQIELGKRSPTFKTLIAIARALGVPLWQIVKEVEESLEEQE